MSAPKSKVTKQLSASTKVATTLAGMNNIPSSSPLLVPTYQGAKNLIKTFFPAVVSSKFLWFKLTTTSALAREITRKNGSKEARFMMMVYAVVFSDETFTMQYVLCVYVYTVLPVTEK